MNILTKPDFFTSDKNFHIQRSSEFPDYIGIPHQHKFIEMVYILSGSATHVIQEQTSKAVKGDLFIINMDTPHVFYADSGDELFISYDLMFTPEFFDRSMVGYHSMEALRDSFIFYSLFGEQQEYTPYIRVSDPAGAPFGEIFHKINGEYTAQKKGAIEIIRAYLMELIVSVFRAVDSNPDVRGSAKTRMLVNYVQDYIRKNYSAKLSTSLLAEKVYMSPDHLGRLFRSTTGMTLSQAIQQQRLQRAMELLTSTDRTIADIAHDCGFEDTKFFYTLFHRHNGCLPSDYRKKGAK